MTKDFLFFNYSWVPNSTYIFKSFENSGYSCDFVDETNIRSFVPTCEYRVVVLYLHENWTLPLTEHIINNYCKNSILIQHDDTDFEHVQVWSSRAPSLVMQRELTENTNNPFTCPVFPHHFPMPSIYNEEHQEKEFDVCFIGAPTNPRREKFISKLLELVHGPLSHLKWYLQYDSNRNHEEFAKNMNKSKIALNYLGNSYDSHRIWEAASAKCCIIQPELPIKSISEEHMPFDAYIKIMLDCSDLQEKIEFALEEDRYKFWAQKAFDEYNQNHTPQKCFEKYHEIFMEHCPTVQKRAINPL